MMTIKENYAHTLTKMNQTKGLTGSLTTLAALVIVLGLAVLAVFMGYGNSVDLTQSMLKFVCFLAAFGLLGLLVDPINRIKKMPAVKNWRINLLAYPLIILFAYWMTDFQALTLYDFDWERILDCLTIGLVEEGLCRLYLLNWFLNRHADNFAGVLNASLISAACFSLIHLLNFARQVANFYYTLNQLVFTFYLGFACVTIYYYSRTIWLPILLHAVTDFVSLTWNPSFQIANLQNLKQALLGHLPYLIVTLLLGCWLIYEAVKQQHLLVPNHV